jgi:hypothetical protein
MPAEEAMLSRLTGHRHRQSLYYITITIILQLMKALE